MTFGFTGTQRGMTASQLTTVRRLLSELHVSIFHLGDCIGADQQAYAEAFKQRIYTIGHPPTNDQLRAFCRYDEERRAKSYLERNKAIVREAHDGLIATPKDFVRPESLRGQGTWTTIGYAQKARRPLWIVVPDGTITEVNNSINLDSRK